LRAAEEFAVKWLSLGVYKVLPSPIDIAESQITNYLYSNYFQLYLFARYMVPITLWLATTFMVSMVILELQYYSTRSWNALKPRAKSWILHWCSYTIDNTLRQGFRQTKFNHQFNAFQTQHTHPLSAPIRTEINAAIDKLAADNGYEIFSVSMSRSDERRNQKGTRCFYTAKDMAYEYRYDQLQPDAIIKLSDVDFYIDDLNDMLVDGHPILLQTFQPTVIAGSIPNAYYWCDDKSVIHTACTGDAKFSHKIWDYSTDCLIAVSFLKTVIYLVEQIPHPQDATRRMVGLFPSRVVYGPWAFLGLIDGKPLQRKNYVHESGMVYNRFLMSDHGQTNIYLSMAQPSSTNSVTLPEEVVEACWLRYCRLYSKTEIGSLESLIEKGLNTRVQNSDEKDAPRRFDRCRKFINFDTAAFVLMSLFEHYGTFFEDRYKKLDSLTEYVEHTYTVIPPGEALLDTPKQNMRALLLPGQQPFVTSAVSPSGTKHSEKAATKGRVEDVRNTARPPNRYSQYADEFIDMFVGKNKHSGVPYSYEQAAEKQIRPTQRAIFARVRLWLNVGTRIIVQSFVKREAYGKITDPRVISTLPGAQKWSFARYVYSISKALFKPAHWYAFAHTPLEIANRLNKLAMKAKHLIPTDYSRFDGRHSEWLAEQELKLFKTFFSPRYHEEIENLLRRNYQARGVTTRGVKYDTGFSRLSGSMDTSICNTFDNALLAYVAFRESGYDAQNAYDSLGLYGGDDGLTPDLSQRTYETVVGKTGCKLTASTVYRGDDVPFLGRIFINPWFEGNNCSMADIPRQAQKLHLTTAAAIVPREQALLRKAEGFLLTDADTPLIGQWARHTIALVKDRKKFSDVEERIMSEDNWWASHETAEQFPQTSKQTMELSAEKLWGASCGFTAETLRWAETKLNESTDFFLFHTEPIFHRNVDVTIRALHGETLVKPGEGKASGSEPVQQPGKAVHNEALGATSVKRAVDNGRADQNAGVQRTAGGPGDNRGTVSQKRNGADDRRSEPVGSRHDGVEHRGPNTTRSKNGPKKHGPGRTGGPVRQPKGEKSSSSARAAKSVSGGPAPITAAVPKGPIMATEQSSMI